MGNLWLQLNRFTKKIQINHIFMNKPQDKAVAQRVRDSITALSPELARAARWVSAHPAELSVQSMRRSAIAAGVLPVTMTRLARALGYTGYEEMRQILQDELVRSAGEDFSLRASRSHPSPLTSGNDLGELTKAQLKNVSAVLLRNSEQDLANAADQILKARSVLFLGQRASYGIAFHLQYSCQLLLPHTSLVNNQAGTIADQIWRLGPEDLLVVVSLSPYTRQTIELAQQAAQKGVGVLALTDSELGPLGQCAAQTLVLEADSPAFFHSMTGALALAEELIAMIEIRGGEATKLHLRENLQRLQKMQAYVDRLPSY